MRRATLALLFLTACEAQPAAKGKSACDALMPANASAHELHLCRVGEQGDADAIYELGADFLYAREGAHRDCAKAQNFMAASAEKGGLFARIKMAELLGGGVFTSAQPVKECTSADYPKAHAYLRAARHQIQEAAKEKQEGAPRVGILPDLEPGLKVLAAKLDIKGKNESDTFFRTLTKESAGK